MKRLPIITVFLLLLLFCNNSIFAQIGITGNNPSPSAVLDLRAGATQKGLLIPQVSLSDITSGNPIVTGSPATSLLVYNTNASVTGGSGTGYYYWDGAKWQRLITGGAKADNMGNHTATQALNMANNNINTVNKLSTITSSIAKGVDGSTPQIGSLLTAGDISGNANWVMPAFQRTFFWKATMGTLSVDPGTSASYPYFNGMSYTAPANGLLDVQMIIFGGFPNMGNPVNGYEYGNLSVTLQALENGVPMPGSVVTTAASPSAIYVTGSGTVTGMKECMWLGIIMLKVTKGATYTFQITGKNGTGYPGDPTAYQAGFGSASTNSPPPGSDGRAYPSLSGVLYLDGIPGIIMSND